MNAAVTYDFGEEIETSNGYTASYIDCSLRSGEDPVKARLIADLLHGACTTVTTPHRHRPTSSNLTVY